MIPSREATASWTYDDGADALYISVPEPRPALSVDLGEGLVVRIDEESGTLVGLTFLNLKARLLEALKADSQGRSFTTFSRKSQPAGHEARPFSGKSLRAGR